MKVELLVTIKGNNMQWMKGVVLETPLHPEIKGFLNNPNILKILSVDENEEIINGKKEKKEEEASQGSNGQEREEEKVIEDKKIKPVIKTIPIVKKRRK